MGKNPHANRNKAKKHVEKVEDEEVPQELIDEAARLGCEIWEVEEYQRREKEENGEGSDDENQLDEIKEAKGAADEDEEEKKEDDDEEEDSSDDDAELERLYGMGGGGNKGKEVIQ